MACISKLASAIAYDCDTGATGLVSAFIINKDDIASYIVGGDSNVSITLAPGAKAYKIDTVKRSLVVSSALKVNDGAPNAYAHTVSGVITNTDAVALRGILRAIPNGQFVVCVKLNGLTDPRVYGMYYGLSATAIENNSHENGGWFSFTLETPENVIGEDQLVLSVPGYDEMYAEAVG
jgi:hypothetical protein